MPIDPNADAESVDETVASPTEGAPTPETDPAPQADASPVVARSGRLLPALLIVSVILAGLFAFLWLQAQARVDELEAVEADRAAVAVAALGFAEALTTWDATDGMSEEIQALRDLGTGAFLDEIDLQFGGDLGAQLQANGVASSGVVEEAFVQSLDRDEATVFATVTQTYRVPSGPLAPIRLPVTIGLRKVDGTWLVRQVQVPADDQLSALLSADPGV